MDIRHKIVDITPTKPVELAGYKFSQLYRDIDSSLEANIVVLSDENTHLILVGVDTLFVGESFYQSIAENIDHQAASRQNVELCMYATHTHTAPSLDEDKPLLGKVDCSYFRTCVQSISNAINEICAQQASGNLGSMGQGNSSCHESVHRRKNLLVRQPKSLSYRHQCAMSPNLTIPSIEKLSIKELRTSADEVKACIWSWPCHPVTQHDFSSVSADFPGMVRDTLRRFYNNDQLPVIYLPGTAGDIRPLFIKNKNWRDYLSQPFNSVFSDSTPVLRKHFDAKLNEAILSAVSAIQIEPVQSTDNIRVKKASTLLKNFIDNFARKKSANKCVSLKPVHRSPDIDFANNQQSANEDSLQIRKIKAGPLEIIDINAEVCSPYFKLNPSTNTTFLTGYSENTFGYLPSDKQLLEGGYEVEEFFPFFSIEGKYKKPLIQPVSDLIKLVEADE